VWGYSITPTSALLYYSYIPYFTHYKERSCGPRTILIMVQSVAYNYWVWTWNNPDVLPSELPIHDNEAYCSWQLEAGEEGTSHLQGYSEFRTRMRLTALKKWLPTAHFEPRKGTAEQAREYTRKEDTRVEGPWERGVFAPVTAGQRTDLEECQAAVEAGATEEEAIMRYPTIFARHQHFIRYHVKRVRETSIPKQVLEVPHKWQSKVIEMVKSPADDRQILWIYDLKGGAGKTVLAKYLVDHHAAFYSNGGKHTDIVHAYKGEPVAIFDYVRESESYVNYGVLEQLKNGICFSPKYESGMKRFPTPHVVVFANFYPTTGKLSEDRLVVIEPTKCGDWSTLYPRL